MALVRDVVSAFDDAQFAIVTFGLDATLEQPLTSDHAAIAAAVKSLRGDAPLHAAAAARSVVRGDAAGALIEQLDAARAIRGSVRHAQPRVVPLSPGELARGDRVGRAPDSMRDACARKAGGA